MGFEESVYHPYDFANRRHIGPSPAEIAEMLRVVGAPSLEALIDETVPAAIRKRITEPVRLAGVGTPVRVDRPMIETPACGTRTWRTTSQVVAPMP